MLCVNCQRLTAMFRRDLCNLCEAAVRPGRKVSIRPETPYRPEDHAGKRAALKELIERSRNPW